MQALSPAALAAASTAAVSAATPFPSLDELRATAERLHGHVLHTPVWRWQTGAAQRLQPPTEVWLKLELFQRTGSFKLRGALNAIAQLDDATRRRGVCAASAGNHAMAVAEAARSAGTHAKLAMPRTASPARVAACRAAGAEVLLFDTIREAFDAARALVDSEGRTMIHPFDGPLTAAGTGTVGLELMDAVPELDAVVVPVGGGGLAGGIAAAVKQLNRVRRRRWSASTPWPTAWARRMRWTTASASAAASSTRSCASATMRCARRCSGCSAT
jgi:threonine dehydratase